MAVLSDLDDCKLEAIFPDKDEEQQVLHYEYYSDTSRVQRKARVEKRWIRQRCLGRGSYGDVWLEFLGDEPNIKRAVKAIRIKDVWSGVDVNYAREVKAMVEFSKTKYREDGHFVHFLGWYDNTRTDTVFLAMEYFPLGDLESHMIEPFAEDSVKVISTQLLHALATMHAAGFTHRDLKPANMFVVQNSPVWWIKLGDFGITKRVQSSATALRTRIGTQDYMAPEFFGYVEDQDEEDPEYTNAVDVWAVGCIVFKLFTQHVPFPSGETMWPLKKYCLGKTSAPQAVLRERGVGNTGVNFVLRLLEPQPSRRLTAGAALEDPWLNSVDGSPSELDLIAPSSPIPLQGQLVDEASMVKNYGPKYASTHKEETVPPRIDLCPGLVTGTEWGLLDPPATVSDSTLPLETSSGEKSDVLADNPAPENPIATPVVVKDETEREDATVKPISRLQQALTIRMPKISPAKRLLDCPLSRSCSLLGPRGLETQELLDEHLVEVHRDWQRTLRKWEQIGGIDHRPVKPYDCPLSSQCCRSHKAGFESEEEVFRHLDVHHGYKDPPKEGDLLVPRLGIFQ